MSAEGWRPIAEAPQYEDVLVYEPHDGGGTVYQARRDAYAEWVDPHWLTCTPTHWLPLPAPPTAGEG